MQTICMILVIVLYVIVEMQGKWLLMRLKRPNGKFVVIFLLGCNILVVLDYKYFG